MQFSQVVNRLGFRSKTIFEHSCIIALHFNIILLTETDRVPVLAVALCVAISNLTITFVFISKFIYEEIFVE